MPRQEITSRQNPRVKDAAKLRDSRARVKQARFIVDGVREIGRALDAGIEFLDVFICPPLCGSTLAKEVGNRLDATDAVIAEMPRDVFEKLSFGERTDGIVAVAATPHRGINSLQLPASPLVAVLEGLEKPGNVGAILRSADGAGVDAVIVVNPETDLFNPNTIRASIGTVFGKNVCVATVEETLAKLRDANVSIVATRPDAKELYSAVDYRKGTAIVLGTEATGLTAAWNESDVRPIRLPMRGIADSLNVSTTAAVLFYESQRQRGIRE